MKNNPRLIQAYRALLCGSVLALTATAASAHFVWLEPVREPAGALGVYFGEFSDLREGSPLLDKIQRVRVYALDGMTRRELKCTPRADHFLAADAAGAPVTVALLDYGVLQRENTPPYLLRYEAELLDAGQKPLPPAEIARLSRTPTGMPLAITLTPEASGRIALAVTLDGKPVAADVAYRGPAGTAMTDAKTDTDGRLELPGQAPGWYHLRIKADDGQAVTYEGKEGKFTRTYLSLMFQQGATPAAAIPVAAAAAVHPDPEAGRILADAHRARANWGADFPGFTADAVYSLDGKTARGAITVDRQFNITYALGDKELENVLRPSFGSLIMHRHGSDVPQYEATWHDGESHPLGRAIDLNDELGSFYRVRDRQILQVNRRMEKQHFVTDVLENEECKLGFLPRVWTVSYYDNETNQLQRVSTTRVTWTWKGGVFLPATIETVDSHGEVTDVSRLVLTNQQFLKEPKPGR